MLVCVCVGMSVCGEVVSKHMWTEIMKLHKDKGGRVVKSACLSTKLRLPRSVIPRNKSSTAEHTYNIHFATSVVITI